MRTGELWFAALTATGGHSPVSREPDSWFGYLTQACRPDMHGARLPRSRHQDAKNALPGLFAGSAGNGDARTRGTRGATASALMPNDKDT